MSRHLRTYLESCQQIEPIETRLLAHSKNQMREQLGDLNELCASIRSHGMLQPIIVRPKGQNFEVICGNRRYEACRRLMKRHVDCIVRDLTDQDAYEIALVENVQRNTLSVLEEASAYKKYIKEFGWGGVTDLSTKIGKSEEYVSHRISLLELPEEIIMKVASGKLNASQAQELVWIKEPEIREELAGLLDQEDLSVKQIREVRKRFENQTCSEPDYENNSKETLRTLTKESSDKKVVEEAILGLRVALVRVDSSISKALSAEVKAALMHERFSLHGMVDSLIRLKVSLSRE